jgi:hypothetical protein
VHISLERVYCMLNTFNMLNKQKSYHIILSCLIVSRNNLQTHNYESQNNKLLLNERKIKSNIEYYSAWNTKTKNLNKYKISKFDAKSEIKIQCLKYVHIKY